MNTGFQLFQLQQIDSAIAEAQKRVLEIEDSISDQNELDLVRQKLALLEDELKIKQDQYDQLNHEIQSKKNKKSQSESMLYAGKIQNPKELQDLQLEINFLSQAINGMEDDLFEKLIDLEKAQGLIDLDKEKLAELQTNWKTRNAQLAGEKTELERLITNYLSKREPIITQLPDEDLAIYEQLRKNKNGVAVGKLQDESCSSCGSSLTASHCQQARSANTLFFCPSCGRIVYGS